MKIALITGASRGLGRSAARELARRSVGVVLTYNSHPEEAQELVAEINKGKGRALALKLDIANTASFPSFLEELRKALRDTWQSERFDYLVNNAGVAQRSLIKDTSEHEFDTLFAVHCKGPFFLTKLLIEQMNEGGHIVNISSGLTRFTNLAGVASYAAMKGALEVLSLYFAREYAARKIRVNCVAPGAIDTQFAGPKGRSEEAKKMIAEQTALGRCGEPNDIGLFIAAILSEDSRWMNAQRIELSGGMHI